MVPSENDRDRRTSFQEDEDNDLSSWQSTQAAIGSEDKIDFQKMDDMNYRVPSMVDRIPPSLVVADQQQLQQEIKQQEDIAHSAGQAFSNWYVEKMRRIICE